jgi:hypothetical protein
LTLPGGQGLKHSPLSGLAGVGTCDWARQTPNFDRQLQQRVQLLRVLRVAGQAFL